MKRNLLIITLLALMMPGAVVGQAALETPILYGTATGSNIVLWWTDIEGADHYTLNVWTAETNWTSWGDIYDTSYSRHEVADGVYWFRVRANGGDGLSGGWSGYLRADMPDNMIRPDAEEEPNDTPLATATPTPTQVFHVNLDAPQIGAAPDGPNISVWWTEVEGADFYTLWRYYSYWEHATSFSGTSYTDTGLEPNSTYYYAVRAERDDGSTSPWSGYASATSGGSSRAATATPQPTATPLPEETDQTLSYNDLYDLIDAAIVIEEVLYWARLEDDSLEKAFQLAKALVDELIVIQERFLE